MTRQLVRPRPDAVFSQAVRVGNTIHVSGQVAVNDSREVVGVGDSEAQARQCFANLARVLAEAGSGLKDVVKLTVFLVGAEHYGGYAVAKRESVAEVLPAGTAVVVAGLMDPRFLMELEAVAIVPDDPSVSTATG
jgi:enamine deaminase RidA (YjgF/YER057c/UK114 family)